MMPNPCVTVDRGGFVPPWFTFGFGVLMVGLYAIAGPMPESLVYDRAAIAAGEVWRLVTGHLVHGDLRHLAANVLALMILGSVLESVLRFDVKTIAAAMLVGMLAVDGLLWTTRPPLAWYCGFSGVLNTLFVLAAYGQRRRTGDAIYGLLALGGLGKIALEAWQAGSLLPTSSLPSVIEAHFAGFVAGLALCMLAAVAPYFRFQSRAAA